MLRMCYFQECSHFYPTESALFWMKVLLGCSVVSFFTTFSLPDSLLH